MVEYQKNMDGLDRGNQHRTLGRGLTNADHFLNWYKNDFLLISDFSLLQAFTAWNMSVDNFRYRWIGVVLRHNNMEKWKLYSSVAEEFLAYFMRMRQNQVLQYLQQEKS